MPADLLSTDSVSRIAREFWETMTTCSLLVVQTLPERSEAQEGVSGTIEIRGAWTGSVEVRASRRFAVYAASSLLLKEASEVTVEECFDAIQEATNIVAGGIKRLLPPICKMAIPAMSGCSSLVPKTAPPAALLTLFTSADGDLSVMVVPENTFN